MAHAPLPSPVVSVKDYGAVGGDEAKDTQGFLSALAAVENDIPGATVLVPPGSYKLASPLVLPTGVSLVGSLSGAWNTDVAAVPELYFYDTGEKPCITMLDRSRLHGFYIHCFDAPSAVLADYGPAIGLGGEQPTISNIKIENMWDGIITLDGAWPGRLQIQNLFMHNVANVGVMLNHMKDFGTIDNVEVWNPDPLVNGVRTGFWFRHVDGLRASRLSVYNLSLGMKILEMNARITNDQEKGFWGEIMAFFVDSTKTGMSLEGPVPILATIMGGTFKCHSLGFDIQASSDASVGIHGTYCKVNDGPLIACGHVGILSITGLTGACTSELTFTDGGIVNITGCSLDAPGINYDGRTVKWISPPNSNIGPGCAPLLPTNTNP
jgi:hypothetical protein